MGQRVRRGQRGKYGRCGIYGKCGNIACLASVDTEIGDCFRNSSVGMYRDVWAFRMLSWSKKWKRRKPEHYCSYFTFLFCQIFLFSDSVVLIAL